MHLAVIEFYTLLTTNKLSIALEKMKVAQYQRRLNSSLRSSKTTSQMQRQSVSPSYVLRDVVVDLIDRKHERVH